MEAGADSQLHAAHGDKWSALRSSQLNAEAHAELVTLREQLAQAEAADGEVGELLEAVCPPAAPEPPTSGLLAPRPLPLLTRVGPRSGAAHAAAAAAAAAARGAAGAGAAWAARLVARRDGVHAGRAHAG